jgi:disulfide bond formation protein DsbB
MITTIITIYILSIIGGYMGIRHMYTTMWTKIDPDLVEVVLILIPLFNTILTIGWIIAICKGKSKINYRKFFNL